VSRRKSKSRLRGGAAIMDDRFPLSGEGTPPCSEETATRTQELAHAEPTPEPLFEAPPPSPNEDNGPAPDVPEPAAAPPEEHLAGCEQLSPDSPAPPIVPPPPRNRTTQLAPPGILVAPLPGNSVHPAGEAPAALPVALPTPEPSLSPLEARVRRLEDALAQLHEWRGREGQIARPEEAPERRPGPGPSTAALLFDVGKRLLAGSEPPPPVTAPMPSFTPTPGTPAASRRPWLLWDTVAEARAIVRMFVDPRYHLSMMGRFLPLVLLAAILTSYYWLPGSSIFAFGYWFNKAVDLLLSFVLFKVLGQEARRYRQTSPDLPPSLRL
jgi:hypothetical protein